MRIKLYAGMPGATSPFLPLPDNGTSGGTLGGTGAPPAPAAPPAAPATPQAPPQQQTAPAAAAAGPNGFPEGVPLEQMQPDQVTNYWKHWAKSNRATLEQREAELAALKPKAEQYDALAAASQTDAERAASDAEKRGRDAGRTEAEQAALARYGRPLVQSRLESLLAGRMTAAQVATLAAGLDVTAFLGTDGLPDQDKVATFAATFAPPAPTGAAQQPAPPVQLGGGRTAPASTRESGDDAYARRHKRSTASPA